MDRVTDVVPRPQVAAKGSEGGTVKQAPEIKNGVGLLRDPRRRDIAPAGELAGLPARDSPKPYLLRTACRRSSDISSQNRRDDGRTVYISWLHLSRFT